MKHIYTILLVTCSLLVTSLRGQTEGSMEIYFPTTGNCYLCKVRIENAVNKLPGIDAVLWDAATDVTYVTYDDTMIDAFEIMQVISYVGHETEWYPANDSAYASLEGTCCFYDKVIDYSNVQPGYLGMMGIWVTELTGIGNTLETGFRIVPASENGLYTISSDQAGNMGNFIVEVYNINGMQLHQGSYGENTSQTLDLRRLNTGLYLVIVARGNQVLYRTKLYKH